MLTALILLATFTPSPTPGALHRCEAWLRVMVDSTCPDPQHPAETIPCQVIGPMVPVTCEAAAGEMRTTLDAAPGELLAFCVRAYNAAGESECGEPVTR